MFHVELRQFPHQARAFNLEQDELERRILGPWVRGMPVELEERRFFPAKAKLVVYEGRRLESSEIGLGRGWANVTKVATDVTARLLESARSRAGSALDDLASALGARGGPLTLVEALDIATALAPDADAEQAIWQLLREGRLVLGTRATP